MSEEQAGPSESTPPLVSLVLSFYNEEPVIDELIDRIRKALDPLPIRYEMIFVNDASTDGSLALLRRHSEKDSRVKILNMSRNFGRYRQGTCTLAGIENASGDAVIWMDTDLQDPPEVLPEMIRAWREGEGVEVVHTRRRKRTGESVFKKAFTAVGYRVLSMIFDIGLPVDSGEFKLVSRRVARHLVEMPDQWPFMRGLVAWLGFKQTFVEYERKARGGGRTHFPFLSGRVLHHHLHTVAAFSSVPLLACFWIGLFGLAGAILFLAAAGVGTALSFEPLDGLLWVAWLTLLGAVHVFMTGLLGLYILELSEQNRRRPRYVIENRIGFDEKS